MYVKRLQDRQIEEIIHAISGEESEVTYIHRPYTDPEVEVISMGMDEYYILHDYYVECCNSAYFPKNATRLHREKMLKFFGPEYARRYLLGK